MTKTVSHTRGPTSGGPPSPPPEKKTNKQTIPAFCTTSTRARCPLLALYGAEHTERILGTNSGANETVGRGARAWSVRGGPKVGPSDTLPRKQLLWVRTIFLLLCCQKEIACARPPSTSPWTKAWTALAGAHVVVARRHVLYTRGTRNIAHAHNSARHSSGPEILFCCGRGETEPEAKPSTSKRLQSSTIPCSERVYLHRNGNSKKVD